MTNLNNTQMSLAVIIVDAIMTGVAFMIFIVYHVNLFIKYKKSPLDTVIGYNHRARKRWCKVMMKISGRELIVVHTMRNALMTSSLFATASLTLSSIVTIFTIDQNNWKEIHRISWFTVVDPIYKLFAIIVCFIIAFFCYMQSIRAYNYLSFLINIGLEDRENDRDERENDNNENHLEYMTLFFNQGADFYTLGSRIFYLAFLIFIWLFGPIPLLLLSIMLIIALRETDFRRGNDVLAPKLSE